MAVKQVTIEGIGEIKLYKRRSARNLRLSIGSGGEIRVSIPSWLPFKAGEIYAREHRDWLLKHQVGKKNILQHGQQVGREHRLVFTNSSGAKPRSRLAGNNVIVSLPIGIDSSSETAQTAAQRGVRSALIKESPYILKRLEEISIDRRISYTSAQCKFLKSRWGSCDRHKHIILNYHLVELTDEQIDYVILHELAHTKHMNHGEDFWNYLISICPDAKRLAKIVRRIRP